MTGERDHASWEELAVGHALHALEPEDEETFLAHLRGCARCERLLDDARAAAADLAYAAPSLEPPEQLRRRISAIPGAEHRPSAVPRVARRPRVSRLPAVPRGSWLAVAAGLVLVVALGVWNLVLHTDNAAKSRELDRRLAVLECVEDSACRQVPLADPETGVARGAVLVRGGTVDVVVDGLPPNDRQSTSYVLWQAGKSGDTMHAVGAFDITCRSQCVVPLDDTLPLPWSPDTVFAISHEATRIPPQSPSAPVAVGSAPRAAA